MSQAEVRVEVIRLLEQFGEKTEFGSLILSITTFGEVLIMKDGESLLVEDPISSERYISWKGEKEERCCSIPELTARYAGPTEIKRVRKILQEVRDQCEKQFSI